MKIATAFIWRESIYKNGFTCNECGTPVADAQTGEPKDELFFAPNEKLLICPNCGNVVAKIKETLIPDYMEEGLQGSWEEFKRGQAN